MIRRTISYHKTMKPIAKAVMTITVFNVVERALGFLFKIYLSREIGAVGMGIYSVATSFFFVLLTLIVSGVPLVVSKLTAKDKSNSGGVCSAALIVELIASVAICLLTLALNKPIGSLFAERESMTLVLIMLPAIVFSGVYSSFRGVLWGEKKFASVSIVELIEQVARILVCIVLFLVAGSNIRAVALSMVIACAVSAGACTIFYFAGRRRLKSPRTHFKPLLSSSVPITLSRTTSSVNGYLTAIAIPFLLMSTGLNSEQSMYVFGSCVGMALPLLYMPITVVGSLAFVMIPTLSTSYAQNDKKSTCSQIQNALTFSIIVAAIALPVLASLGDEIGILLYDNADAGMFLKKSAWLLIPLSFENIASSMLNSLDLEKKSLINYLIGAAAMYIVCFCFYSRFNMDIYMIAFGLSLVLSSVLDIIDIKRRTGFKLTFLRPLITCLVAAYPSWLLTEFVSGLIQNGILSMIVSAVGGAAFMALLAVIFGAVDFEIHIGKRRKRARKNLLPGPRLARKRKSSA